MCKLAIVIPAYKSRFLLQALESLSKQTCKEFCVYIGDDASPYDIKSIVDMYKDKIRIKYLRFETNLGGNDLVAHWERCINMTEDEAWIWLFSDDDEMDPTCVELFYKEIQNGAEYDLYHFDVNVINENSDIIGKSIFPTHISTYDFAFNRLKGKLLSYVVEYVFSRKQFEKCGKFQNFALAWGSDDATWIKIGSERGVKTIKGACVRWRKSVVNITPNNTNVKIVCKKIQANLDYLKWLNAWLNIKVVNDFRLVLSEITWFCVNISKFQEVLPSKLQYSNIMKACIAIRQQWLIPFAFLYYLIKK